MQGIVPQEASAMQWSMQPGTQLEWIPQYTGQVDHNGDQVMFAVPAVRVMAQSRGQKPQQDASGRLGSQPPQLAEAGWLQDLPGACARTTRAATLEGGRARPRSLMLESSRKPTASSSNTSSTRADQRRDGGDSPCSTRSPVETADTQDTECDSPHRVRYSQDDQDHMHRANFPGGRYSDRSSLADSDLPVDAFNAHRGRAQHSYAQGGGSSSSLRRESGKSSEEGWQRSAPHRGVPAGPPVPPGSQKPRGRGAAQVGHRRSRDGAPASHRSQARGGARGSGSRSSAGLDELLEGEEERVEEGRYPPGPPSGRGFEDQLSAGRVRLGVESRPGPLPGRATPEGGPDTVVDVVQEVSERGDDPRLVAQPSTFVTKAQPSSYVMNALAGSKRNDVGLSLHPGNRQGLLPPSTRVSAVSDCSELPDDVSQRQINPNRGCPRRSAQGSGSRPGAQGVARRSYSVSDEELLEEGSLGARGASQEPVQAGRRSRTHAGDRAQQRPVRDAAPPHPQVFPRPSLS